MIKITTPLTSKDIETLSTGDEVLINGIIYTGRDAAHKKLFELLEKNERLPVDLKGQIIYYVGPTPAKPGRVIGSAGPTTSGRMDKYAPRLLEYGLKGMIGKGLRSKEVQEAIVRNKAVYFAAIGGAGALLSKTIVKSEVVAYPELGPEAIYRLEVVDFPAVVVIDAKGQNLYEIGPKKFQRD